MTLRDILDDISARLLRAIDEYEEEKKSAGNVRGFLERELTAMSMQSIGCAHGDK